LRHPCSHSLGADISPSTETQNLRCERKVLMSLIKLVENSNLDNLHSKPECHVVDIEEHRGRRHIIVEVKGHVVR
jgi:hypothetical protein